MDRRRVGTFLALAALLLLGACGQASTNLLGKTYPPVHYRLAAEIETPEGIRTGSSVIAVQWSLPGTLFGAMGSAGFAIDGEAVAIDLPKGERLFILLQRPDDMDWASRLGESIDLPPDDGPVDPQDRFAVQDRQFQRLIADRAVHPLHRRRKSAAEDADDTPYFVRLATPGDPRSMMVLDPDQLEKAYGPGYRLKALTVQVTDAPVTRTIAAQLAPGFFDAWERYSAGIAHCRNVDHPYFRLLAARIYPSAFIRNDNRPASRAAMDAEAARRSQAGAIPCEQLIPGYRGGTLRRLFEPPVFSPYIPPEGEETVQLARWTPGAIPIRANWKGKLALFHGCLALERGPNPMLIVFPFGEGAWDAKRQRLLYRDKEYAIGDPIDFADGDFIHLFIDKGKAERLADTPDLGKTDFRRCDGYELFLVNRRKKQP